MFWFFLKDFGISKYFQITVKTSQLVSVLSLAETVIWNEWEIQKLGSIQKLRRYEGEDG